MDMVLVGKARTVGGETPGGKSEVGCTRDRVRHGRRGMLAADLIASEWLEALRAYPRWLVLLCAGVAGGCVLALVAKPLKWMLYAGLAGLLGIFLLGVAWLLGR